MEKEIIVVKYGSTSVADESGIVQDNLGFYASQLAAESEKYGIVVVSSGAVSVGQARYTEERENRATDRVYAQMGAHEVVGAWSKAFDEFGILTAGLLVTHREIDDAEEGGEFLAAIKENLGYGLVTVLNENDALSNVELAKLAYGGDNDRLAAHTAIKLGAKALYLMTDKRGVRRNDRNRSGIRTVRSNDHDQQAIFKHIDDNNGQGRGGMRSKCEAAIEAANMGTEVYIADAKTSFRAIHSTGKTQSSTKFEAKNSKLV